MKDSVQTQWGKLTDDDLSVARGSRDHFVGRVKERCGVAKEEAERQVDEFMQRQPKRWGVVSSDRNAPFVRRARLR